MLRIKKKKVPIFFYQGFTMIEILIVIGIMIILGGIVFVAINPAEKLAKARNTQRNIHIEAIYAAIDHYVFQNNRVLPGSGGSCFDGKSAGTTFDAYECESFLTPHFLNEIPIDPTDGTSSETGYLLKKDNNGKVGVKAAYAELGEDIEVGVW